MYSKHLFSLCDLPFHSLHSIFHLDFYSSGLHPFQPCVLPDSKLVVEWCLTRWVVN